MSVLFLLASCSKSTDPEVHKPTANINAPIIWQTPIFGENIQDFSVSGEVPVLFLIANKGAGLQMYDSDGTATAQPGSYSTTSLGHSVAADFDGATLRLFPAVDEKSHAVTLYAFADGMLAPNDVALIGAPDSGVDGLCSGPAKNDGDIAQIAYWTALDPATLVVGSVSLDGAQLTFQEEKRLQEGKYLTACGIDAGFIVTGGGFGMSVYAEDGEPKLIDTPAVPLDISVKAIAEGGLAAAALSNNRVYIAKADGTSSRLVFEDGLSTPAPERINNIDMTTAGTVGSFPDGFIAVESVTNTGSQLIFVDLKTITDQL